MCPAPIDLELIAGLRKSLVETLVETLANDSAIPRLTPRASVGQDAYKPGASAIVSAGRSTWRRHA